MATAASSATAASTSSSKLVCPAPTFRQPSQVVQYLADVANSFLTSSVKQMPTVMELPSAFDGLTWDVVPETAEYPLSSAYKEKANSNSTASAEKQAAEQLDRQLYTLLYGACKEHSIMRGLLDTAPFVRFSTFRAWIEASYGGGVRRSAPPTPNSSRPES